jgi:hypothetical protein
MFHDAGSARADQDPHKTPQLLHSAAAKPAGRPKKGSPTARSWVMASCTGRATIRGSGEVIELECGITVYPAREDQGRWRAVWYENGRRRQCEAATEHRLAARLAKVAERLAADAPNLERTGADLIAHYLDPGRLPVRGQWSRKHAHTQRRLCERFAAPVIDTVTCQDITATSCSAPTWPPDGATSTATAPGPGTACGTCSAPPPCSPGSSTPPTCPAWPATPTTASPWTCTSAPPPASWTAPAPPPNNHAQTKTKGNGKAHTGRDLPQFLLVDHERAECLSAISTSPIWQRLRAAAGARQ